ncbi:MAG: hypothetical protein WAN51_01700 [Alphaproteobacteria bacterium]
MNNKPNPIETTLAFIARQPAGFFTIIQGIIEKQSSANRRRLIRAAVRSLFAGKTARERQDILANLQAEWKAFAEPLPKSGTGSTAALCADAAHEDDSPDHELPGA